MDSSIPTLRLKLPFLGLLCLGLSLGFLLVTSMDNVFVQNAEAVIGRPASPGSVAGVRRRTRRRTVRRAAAASTVATLPAGCVTVVTGGMTYYQCGTVYYRPYYQGNEVVYIEESP
jgi:hypothetical protein